MMSDKEGYVSCPGAMLHKERSSGRDCKLYLYPVITVYCFHASCSDVVKDANTRLRALALSSFDIPKLNKTPEQRARLVALREKTALKLRAASAQASILRDFAWTYEAICKESPVTLEHPSNHPQHIFDLFDDSDVIWNGYLFESGEVHKARFQAKDEWLSDTSMVRPFTCPAAFIPASFSRTKENILRQPYLVVESDNLDVNEVGAIFNWLRSAVGLSLIAVVDTAGKSLHAWFKYPPQEELDDLKIMLPAMGCDPKMFNATQPCRMVGALRGGKFQKLIYLATKEVTHE